MSLSATSSKTLPPVPHQSQKRVERRYGHKWSDPRPSWLLWPSTARQTPKRAPRLPGSAKASSNPAKTAKFRKNLPFFTKFRPKTAFLVKKHKKRPKNGILGSKNESSISKPKKRPFLAAELRSGSLEAKKNDALGGPGPRASTAARQEPRNHQSGSLRGPDAQVKP